jgi:hypothetical protein
MQSSMVLGMLACVQSRRGQEHRLQVRRSHCEPVDQLKTLHNDERVIDQSPGRVDESRAEIVGVAVPERLVREAPLRDADEALARGFRGSDVHISKTDHMDVLQLDDRHRHLRGVDDQKPLAGSWQRLAVELPFDQQPGGRRLLSGQDGIYQAIA